MGRARGRSRGVPSSAARVSRGSDALLAMALASACSHTVPTAPSPPEARLAEVSHDLPSLPPGPSVDVPPSVTTDAGRDASPTRDAPHLSTVDIAGLLFPEGDPRPPCEEGDDGARAHCLISARYASDGRAAEVALDLFDRTGDVAGLSPPETMEGGWRGQLHLVPALPVGKERRHLEWVAEAARDYDWFFEELSRGEAGAPRYVWRGLAFRFMRSVGARTPSAYAIDWTIAYNLAGSLNTGPEGVSRCVSGQGQSRHLATGSWGFHPRRSRAMALRMVSSFRMQAMSATCAGFPFSTSRSYMARIVGFHCRAAEVAI